MNIRVADIRSCYAEWRKKGAEFLTEPKEHKFETRCYMRDPDGYTIEGKAKTADVELLYHLLICPNRLNPPAVFFPNQVFRNILIYQPSIMCSIAPLYLYI
jgi:hypothetical protein